MVDFSLYVKSVSCLPISIFPWQSCSKTCAVRMSSPPKTQRFFSPEARIIAEIFSKDSKAKKMVISDDHGEITAARSPDG
jgi:hypothetical protein